MKLEETSTSTWWSENRDTQVSSVLGPFHSSLQGPYHPIWLAPRCHCKVLLDLSRNKDFQDFVTQLQAAQNTLASAGAGYAISESVFKNHLMFSSPGLQFRGIAIVGIRKHQG